MALSALTGAALSGLTGCSKLSSTSKGSSTGPSSSSSPTGPSSGSPRAKTSSTHHEPSTDWQELDGHIAGHHITVRVSPVIRKDEATSILALELTRAPDDPSDTEVIKIRTFNTPEGKFAIRDYWNSRAINHPPDAVSAVRVMDLQTDRVWNCIDGSHPDPGIAPGEKVTHYALFGKIDAEQVTVFVPMTGFATVSVLEASSAQQASLDLATAQAAMDDSAKPNTKITDPVAIERYTRALDYSTSTKTGSKDVTVTLNSDVTFASDSADLAPGAQAQLQSVAGQLGQYPDGGTLTIVGHTDDVQDDAYNQTLSEKRANAVKTRLEQLTSLDKWKTSVSGKGESEPKVKDTTDQARATNRRVEITLTPTGGTTNKNNTATAAPSSSSKLPDPQGPVAKGSDGVTVTNESPEGGGKVTITLDHVTRQDGYLLGVLTCTVDPSSISADLTAVLTDLENRMENQRNEGAGSSATILATDGLTLISNTERVFPADHKRADIEAHIPLTELYAGENPRGGTVTTIGVVWPDPGGETVILDHTQVQNTSTTTAFRLTDIPVKNT